MKCYLEYICIQFISISSILGPIMIPCFQLMMFYSCFIVPQALMDSIHSGRFKSGVPTNGPAPMILEAKRMYSYRAINSFNFPGFSNLMVANWVLFCLFSWVQLSLQGHNCYVRVVVLLCSAIWKSICASLCCSCKLQLKF